MKRFAMFDAKVASCLLAGLAVLLLAACDSEPVALEVGPVGFSDDDLRGLGDAGVDDLVRITTLALAVRDDGVEALGAPVVERRARDWQVGRLRDALVLEAAGVEEFELEARYASDPEWELEVRHLVVMVEPWEPEARHERARNRAQQALEEVRDGADFAGVAGSFSDEPGAERRGGLLSPGREGTWVGPFWEAALSLEVGEVSDVVETEYGYHVLKLEDRRAVPFEEARTRVVRDLAGELGGGAAWEAHREALVEDLRIDAEGARAGGIEVPARTVEEHLAALPAGDRRALGGSDEEARALLEEVALHLLLAEQARERGIEPRPEDRASFLRDWERDVGAWTSFLSLGGARSTEDVARASLAALRSNDQNARIARQEMAELAPVLEAGTPVRRPGEEEAVHHPARLPLPDPIPGPVPEPGPGS